MPEDLKFLSLDIKRQQEIAQQALDEAKKLDTVLSSEAATSPDAKELKEKLQEAKEMLLRVARELAVNANTTSSNAITVVSSLAKAK
jgi:hypothetical protein